MDALLTGLVPVAYPGAGPAGDLGEGSDVPVAITGQAGRGEGGRYTPLPGVLPTKDHLEYVQKFSVATLLLLGLVMLIVVGIIHPGRALGLLATGAKRQAGIA